MSAYIDHALSFARMNSVIVRNGTRPTAITVAPSSRRGPSSPAMRISILMFESATCIAIAEAKHPRRLEGSVVGISRANWSFVNDSHGRGARLLQGEVTIAKSSFPAQAWRTRRKG